jgi:hypothetical protein
MAGKDAFTPEEWEQLKKGVLGSTLLVSTSDPGFFESFKEAGTAAKHMAAGRESPSQLVKDLAEERPAGFGVRTDAQELEQETVAALRAAAATLRAKAPDDADAYRQFVLDVAKSVAAAAGGVDPRESDAIQTIEAALSAG